MTSVNVIKVVKSVIVTKQNGTTVIVNQPKVSTVKIAKEGPQGQKGDSGSPGPPKSITIAQPKPGDQFTLLYTQVATTFTQVIALVRGISASAAFELRYGADRSSAGTLATVPLTVSNVTTGELAEIQNMPIPANNYVWIVVTSVTSQTEELNVSIEV